LSIKLKAQAIKLGLGIFHLVRYGWKFFSFTLVLGFVRPVGWFVRSVLLQALIPPYRTYRRFKQKAEMATAASKNTWLYPFTTRYLIHVVVILMTFGIAANGVFAREPKVEEYGSQALLSNFYQESDDNTESTEYALPSTQANLSSLTREGTIDRYHQTDIDPNAERNLLAIARQESNGAALTKVNSPTTDLAGAPRSAIVDYVVEGGDTLGLIAEKYGISANTLRWANGLDERAMIKPGQNLKIPPVSGIVYTVASGDTLIKIAQKYHADATGILDFNRLADASALEVGNQIVIPGGFIEPPKPIAPSYPQTRLVYGGDRPPSANPVGGGLFWPTPSHRINQGYSVRHGGIDIDSNKSPIYAAAAGRVVRTNWGRGYGNNIILDNGNGIQTLYAHLTKSYVGVGDTVAKGETIAISGSTGWSTGDHLHFEVWVNGRRTNPFNYF